MHNQKQTNSFFIYLSLFFIFSSFLFNTPHEIYNGMIRILTGPDVLITDYFEVGNIGSALLNAGLLSLLSTCIIIKSKTEFSGNVIASIMLMISFGLFGKNIINVIPILLGTLIYSVVTKEPYKEIVHMSLLATSFSPIVTELFFINASLALRLFLSLSVGIIVGFTIKPVARSLYKVHDGYSLANVGFAVGILGTLIVSIMKSYGYVPKQRAILSSGNNLLFIIILLILFTFLLGIGWLYDRDGFSKYNELCKHSGFHVDYYELYGLGGVLINMAVNGFIGLFFVVVVAQGELNGPTIGGILTIVGFSGVGKNWRNIIPIFIGVWLGGISKNWSLDNPSVILGALFGTSLAPISGVFGPVWGIVAGYINSSVVLNTGIMNAGMNLYNTGFSVGIVAAVLVPILKKFKEKI